MKDHSILTLCFSMSTSLLLAGRKEVGIFKEQHRGILDQRDWHKHSLDFYFCQRVDRGSAQFAEAQLGGRPLGVRCPQLG